MQTQSFPADGMLLVMKEAGWTSFDVTAKLRGVMHTRKVGHTGTLDPEATGVLPVLYGKATRLAELFSDHDKTYEAVMRLGTVTDTQDMTGRILSVCENLKPWWDPEKIRLAAASFEGDQLQVPPMYSALKVNGQKLYKLARAGISVERQARPVHFERISVKKLEEPLITLEVCCSKGTYIRTLCHDLGARLGCGGTMESLVRTRVGRFSLDGCHTIGRIEAMAEEGRLNELVLSLDEMLSDVPAVDVPENLDKLLVNGNPLKKSQLAGAADGCLFCEGGWARMITSQGKLAALYRLDAEKELLRPLKMLI